jgi:hypothetical protein
VSEATLNNGLGTLTVDEHRGQCPVGFRAGCGTFEETLRILEAFELGMSPKELAERVIHDGVFSRLTATSTRKLVLWMFAHRFLQRGGDAVANLKLMLENRFPIEVIKQLCFVYTVRAEPIFAEFLREEFWPKYRTGAKSINRDEVFRFIRRFIGCGRTSYSWSDATVRNVVGCLLKLCVDYGLLSGPKKSEYEFRNVSPKPEVLLYLAHELHFQGVGDAQLAHHPSWMIFGYLHNEVLDLLKRLSQDGYFLFQSSGELVQIGWKHKSMKDLIYALKK